MADYSGVTNPAQNTDGPATTQLVVFRLADSEYALPVEQVGEVLRMVAIAPVPDTDHWIPGVINLRGRVVPIVDLRARLALPSVEFGTSTPIIVAALGDQKVGLVADSVSDFLTVPLDLIAPPDEFAGSHGSIAGVVRADDRLILLFDLERLCAGFQRALAAAA